MNEPADEEFAKEAVQGYNAANNSSTVRNIELVISKEELIKRLGMSGTSEGEAWTKKQVRTFLGETEEEQDQRKNKKQGIPTAAIKEQNRLMRFIAHVVCLKDRKSVV